MDPVGTPFFEMSLHSYLHYAFGILVFSLAPVSRFIFFGHSARIDDGDGFSGGRSRLA
jgi:hypothetical protein